MKKIQYEEAVGAYGEMIDIYAEKVKNALDERNIAVVYFGNAPAANPNDENWDCYDMLKYENGEFVLANACGLDDYPEESTILTKEEYEAGALAECHFAEAFAKAEWDTWYNLEQEGPNSWDSLYYCLCQAINECADEE